MNTANGHFWKKITKKKQKKKTENYLRKKLINAIKTS